MRVGGVTLVWVAWSCVGVMLSEGGGVARTLTEAGERLLALKGGDGPLTNKVLELRTPADKLTAIRQRLVHGIIKEAKQLPSNNQSIMSIAFLAFGVILFDVLADAMFGGTSNILAALGANGGAQARVAVLPGFGLFGDNLNNLAEVVLNMITIYLYRDESPDCGERLLCESNQQAVSRGFFDSLVTYISGFAVSFFLHEAPLSRNLEAMRSGRKGQNCIEIYPQCSITL
ncbi:putative DM4/DM12 family-like protein 8 [Homarus americanus]|uniref:Putative DM4/DM12 family-like protein 8 n=1 Tax=Homarus americanus TaxID=6706 RepID=A0A8J5JV29_HOMAM|nr:putative DM4/DM12 family-like protein 8 [Homarus americanus]